VIYSDYPPSYSILKRFVVTLRDSYDVLINIIHVEDLDIIDLVILIFSLSVLLYFGGRLLEELILKVDEVVFYGN
jgi:hypothetical protein